MGAGAGPALQETGVPPCPPQPGRGLWRPGGAGGRAGAASGCAAPLAPPLRQQRGRKPGRVETPSEGRRGQHPPGRAGGSAGFSGVLRRGKGPSAAPAGGMLVTPPPVNSPHRAAPPFPPRGGCCSPRVAASPRRCWGGTGEQGWGALLSLTGGCREGGGGRDPLPISAATQVPRMQQAAERMI